MSESSSLRLLVTGASGQVGGELLKILAPLGEVVAPLRDGLDLSSPSSIQSCIRSVKPSWIVNAGAYTAVDKAESEQDLAYTINADAPRIIAEEAQALGASIIHFSTDYVFNGQGTTPYVETDPTDPLGVYGASKLAGEQALLATGTNAMIFRTSWVYGATGKNFLRTILKLAREREELRIVSDQHGAPTWSRDLAHLASHVIRHCEANKSSPFTGIYHAAGSGETTWAGFAAEAVRQSHERHPSTPFANITGIPTSEYPTPASRPQNSRLNCTKLTSTFGWKMPDWHDSLTQVLGELE